MSNLTKNDVASRWVWVGLTAIASVFLSIQLQCVLPFAALAAIGVLDLRRSEALTLVGLAWGINQVLGYTVLGYPHEVQSYAWGLMIGLGAVAAVFAGEPVRELLSKQTYAVRAAAVLAIGYAAYEAVLFSARVVLPASDVAFSMRVVVEYGVVNAVAFVALVGLHAVLTQAGLFGRHTKA